MVVRCGLSRGIIRGKRPRGGRDAPDYNHEPTGSTAVGASPHQRPPTPATNTRWAILLQGRGPPQQTLRERSSFCRATSGGRPLYAGPWLSTALGGGSPAVAREGELLDETLRLRLAHPAAGAGRGRSSRRPERRRFVLPHSERLRRPHPFRHRRHRRGHFRGRSRLCPRRGHSRRGQGSEGDGPRARAVPNAAGIPRRTFRRPTRPITTTPRWWPRSSGRADHPAIVSLFSIGMSYEGRAVWAVKISDNVGTDENEPEVLFTGHQHAREHLTVEMTLYILHLLADNYGIDTADHQPGQQPRDLDRLRPQPGRRRVRHRHRLLPVLAQEPPAQHRLVLRRHRPEPQLGLQVGLLRRLVSGSPAARPTAAPSAFSAPETQRLRDFVDSRVIGGEQQIKANIDFHTYARAGPLAVRLHHPTRPAT